MHHFGDSYDLVKQSLLRWLRNFGEWSVHPMFTETVYPAEVAAFERLLGAKVVSTETLTIDTDRLTCECARLAGHVSPQFLFAAELQRLIEARPHRLTMVFDQCIGRGSERKHLDAKLQGLRENACSHGPMCLMPVSSWLDETRLFFHEPGASHCGVPVTREPNPFCFIPEHNIAKGVSRRIARGFATFRARFMAFRALSSFIPTADELLALDLPSLGRILVQHLKKLRSFEFGLSKRQLELRLRRQAG